MKSKSRDVKSCELHPHPVKGTRPSRPRPGQAVAVAETAGGAGRVLKLRVERPGACVSGHEVRVSRDEESETVTEERSSCRTLDLPGETLTSRASRGGHSLPGPPRDARDATRTGGASHGCVRGKPRYARRSANALGAGRSARRLFDQGL